MLRQPGPAVSVRAEASSTATEADQGSFRFGNFVSFVLFAFPAWIWVAFKMTKLKLTNPAAFQNKLTEEGERVSDADVAHPAVQGVTHEYLQLPSFGMTIHVARAGTGQGKPLVLFLHGFPEFWYSWRHQLEALQSDYEVAAMDLPGYNASSKPASRSAYISGNLCTTVAEVLDALGHKTCNLVGHDWGGALAFDFAATHADRVERLAVLATPPPALFIKNMDGGQLSRSMYMYVFTAPSFAEQLLSTSNFAMLDTMFTDPSNGGLVRSPMSAAEVAAYKAALARPGALTAALNYYRASFIDESILGRNRKTTRQRRSTLSMPVLILWGDSDAALSPNLLTNIGSIAPTADVRLLPRCSHWIQQDAPKDVNAALRELLARLPA